MAAKPNFERAGYSPGEFAALFGKSQTWGYRQIYAQKVTAVTEYGRILIPAAEVERLLKTAGLYDGVRPTPPVKKKRNAGTRKAAVPAEAEGVGNLSSGKPAAKLSPAAAKFASKDGGLRKAALLRLFRKKQG